MNLLIPVVVVVALALVAAVVWMGLPKGPSLKSVEHLTKPHLAELGPQKVLMVEAKGDPNVVAKEAFGLLMKSYFRLKGVPKGGPDFKPPRARWKVEAGQPIAEWEGSYAMPVPDSVTEVPAVKGEGERSLELTQWEYGQVAQVLHVGGYDKEEGTIRSLHQFVHNVGLEISGIHEEEYLKGPGMLFRGNPDSYLTLIRVPVREIGSGGGGGWRG